MKSLAISIAILFVAVVHATDAMGQSSKIREYEVHYTLKLGGVKVGKSFTSYSKVGANEYESVLKLNPGLVLKVTGERKSTQTSTIRVVGDKVLSDYYRIEYKRKNTKGADFDWTNRQIKILDGEVIPMPENDVHEWGSWYLSLMQSNPEDLPGKHITIVTADGIIDFVYGELEEDTITVESKPIVASRIRMQNINKKNRAYTFWLSSEYSNIPVKIQRHKQGVTVDILLKSIKWNS